MSFRRQAHFFILKRRCRVSANQEQYRKDMRNEVLTYLDSYEGDWEKAKDYLDVNREFLTDDDYKFHSNRIDNELKDQQDAEKKSQEEKDKRIITGQESFEYNGKYYQIGSRLDDNANEIKHNRDFTEQLKNLGFTDPFDKNIPNGTTLTVKSDAYGSNEHNWKDWVGGVDITDWRNWIPGYNIYNQINNWANLETRTLTFYNGKWYSSSEVGR